MIIFSCFQVFNIAHALTNTPETLGLATTLTLEEFQNDGCYYIELRSTPRDTTSMTKKQYIDTIVGAMQYVLQIILITKGDVSVIVFNSYITRIH